MADKYDVGQQLEAQEAYLTQLMMNQQSLTDNYGTENKTLADNEARLQEALRRHYAPSLTEFDHFMKDQLDPDSYTGFHQEFNTAVNAENNELTQNPYDDVVSNNGVDRIDVINQKAWEKLELNGINHTTDGKAKTTKELMDDFIKAKSEQQYEGVSYPMQVDSGDSPVGYIPSSNRYDRMINNASHSISKDTPDLNRDLQILYDTSYTSTPNQLTVLDANGINRYPMTDTRNTEWHALRTAEGQQMITDFVNNHPEMQDDPNLQMVIPNTPEYQRVDELLAQNNQITPGYENLKPGNEVEYADGLASMNLTNEERKAIAKNPNAFDKMKDAEQSIANDSKAGISAFLEKANDEMTKASEQTVKKTGQAVKWAKEHHDAGDLRQVINEKIKTEVKVLSSKAVEPWKNSSLSKFATKGRSLLDKGVKAFAKHQQVNGATSSEVPLTPEQQARKAQIDAVKAKMKDVLNKNELIWAQDEFKNHDGKLVKRLGTKDKDGFVPAVNVDENGHVSNNLEDSPTYNLLKNRDFDYEQTALDLEADKAPEKAKVDPAFAQNVAKVQSKILTSDDPARDISAVAIASNALANEIIQAQDKTATFDRKAALLFDQDNEPFVQSSHGKLPVQSPDGRVKYYEQSKMYQVIDNQKSVDVNQLVVDAASKGANQKEVREMASGQLAPNDPVNQKLGELDGQKEQDAALKRQADLAKKVQETLAHANDKYRQPKVEQTSLDLGPEIG